MMFSKAEAADEMENEPAKAETTATERTTLVKFILKTPEERKVNTRSSLKNKLKLKEINL
jgi:hypothetical protein